ncbi:hypothetical protein TWF173_004715 [Orbilia oligospora]|nr:hypothetical protein TWF173_004715 [Orbilia oligospora]
MSLGTVEMLWKTALAEYKASTEVDLEDEKCETVLQKITDFWGIKEPSAKATTSAATNGAKGDEEVGGTGGTVANGISDIAGPPAIDQPPAPQNSPKKSRGFPKFTNKQKNPTDSIGSGGDGKCNDEGDLAKYIMGYAGCFETERTNGTWNEIGHLLAQYIPVAAGLLSIVGEAASLVFPPASILVVIVARAGCAISTVSQNLDAVRDLFDTMRSFSKRIDLLENKVPRTPFYQRMVIEAFRGDDATIKIACDKVLQKIHNLDVATIFQTLATASDTNEMVTGLVDSTKSGFAMISSEVKSNREESKKDHHESMKHAAQGFAAIKALMIQLHPGDKSSSLKIEPTEFKFFQGLTKSLATGAEEQITQRIARLKKDNIAGISDWVGRDPKFVGVCQREKQNLYVAGKWGLGKSFFAYSIYSMLRTRACTGPSVAIAYFAFDRNIKELHRIGNMWKSCCLQVTEQNEGYRKDVRDMLQRDTNSEKGCYQLFGLEPPEGPMPGPEMSSEWKTDLKEIFFVIDGVEEMEEEERELLLDLVRDRETSNSRFQTYFVLVGSPESLSPDGHCNSDSNDYGGQLLSLDRETLRGHGNFKEVAKMKVDSPLYPALAQLPSPLKDQIVSQIGDDADNFFYIDHALRRLNDLGSRFMIEKKLTAIPKSTTQFYVTLLESCARSHTEKEKEMLGYLFTWLTYSELPLSINAAQNLLDVVAESLFQGTKLDIEEEASVRVSKILTILDADPGGPDSENPGNNEAVFINFQESSLREYFRHNNEPDRPGQAFPLAIIDGGADRLLRPPKLTSHIMMLKMSLIVLTEKMEDISTSELERIRYFTARFWRQCVHGIIDQIDQEQENETVERDLIQSVAEDLSKFFGNEKDGITRLENIQDILGLSNRGSDDLKVASILGQGEEEQRELLGKIVKLVNHAPVPAEETTTSIIKRLAKVHIENLLTVQTPNQAYISSRFAIQALYNLENIKPESLKDFTELSDALSGSTYEDGKKSFDCKLLEDVVNFGKTELDVCEKNLLDLSTDGESRLCPHTYGQISMALYYDASGGLLGEDAAAARKGLEKAEEPRDKFFLGYRIARACFSSLEAENGESFDSQVRAIWDNMKNRQGDIEEARGLFFDAVKEAEHIEKDFDLNQDPELKSTINLAYQMMAFLEVQLEGHRDNVSETMIAAKRMSSRNTHNRYIDYLIQVFGRLEKWNDISKLIGIIQNPLVKSPNGPLHQKSYKYIHRAAIICKNMDDVRRLYEEADCTTVDESQRNLVKSMLEIQRGVFERSVGRVKAARRSFYRVLDSKYNTAELRVAAINLSNIVLRKLHGAKTFEKKQEAKQKSSEEFTECMASSLHRSYRH